MSFTANLGKRNILVGFLSILYCHFFLEKRVFRLTFKLCDFGLSRTVETSSQEMHSLCGTPGYMVR